MDLLFEFIIEFIFEVFFDSDFSEDTKKRIPLPIRILITIVILVAYIGLIVLITVGAIKSWNNGKYEMFAVLVVIDVLILIMVLSAFIKKRRKK